jgi:phosphoribosyl-ATP pyrophosphohydrolase
MAKNTLELLAETIAARRNAAADASYTRKLLDGGPAKCARKFGEEAVEAMIAALDEDDEALKGEAADVLYHLLVLLEARNIPFDDVLAVLDQRTAKSGLEEKSSRPGIPQ